MIIFSFHFENKIIDYSYLIVHFHAITKDFNGKSIVSKYFMLGYQSLKIQRNLKATSKGQRLAQIMLNTNLTKYNI